MQRRVEDVSESPAPPADGQPTGISAADKLPPVGAEPHHFLVQAPVPVLDVDGLTATILGLAAFGLASLLALVFYPDLQQHGRGWWLGVCVSGVGLGLIGLGYCLYRRERRRAGRWDRD